MSDGSQRWIIRGILETRSPLSIRTGSEEVREHDDAKRWQARPGEANTPPVDDRQIAPIQAIEADCNGNPYIPATAIKGLLRSLATQRIDDEALGAEITALFGNMPSVTEGSDAKQSTGGVAIFRNAYLIDKASMKPAAIRGRTAINRGTRTARDGFLRHDRAVPSDTQFKLEVVLDRASEDTVGVLLSLLQELDGSGRHSSLGSGSGQGDGRIAWVLEAAEARRFGHEQMADWLQKPIGTHWADLAVVVRPQVRDLGQANRSPRVAFPLSLTVDGHFLVSVAAPVGKADSVPDRVPFKMRDDEQPTAWLPGSSLDGALSAQAERIWRTLAYDLRDWGKNGAPTCHRELFGSTERASLLDVSTFSSDPAETREVQVEFVAIDRFTGGSLDKAKFSVRAFEAPVFRGEIGLTLRRSINHSLSGKPKSGHEEISISASAIGLLALTIRDLAEGDIPLGYGTRKGFGRIGKLEFRGSDWRALLNALGDAASRADGPVELRGLAPDEAIRKAVAALESEAAQFRTEWQQRSAESSGEDAA